MQIPSSEHLQTLNISSAFNRDKASLEGSLECAHQFKELQGESVCRGIPFELGVPAQNNVILLDQEVIKIELEKRKARYLLFLHQVEDRDESDQPEFTGHTGANRFGDHVSSYTVHYDDGSEHVQSVRRRFEIQQGSIHFGCSPMRAVPSFDFDIVSSHEENLKLGRTEKHAWGFQECRQASGRKNGCAWIYALENPYPEKEITSITLKAMGERSLIYAISTTELEVNPIRFFLREKYVLTLPKGVEFNKNGEIENLDIDLGCVISARRAMDYPVEKWNPRESDCQPEPSHERCILEVSAHPEAKLYLECQGQLKSYPINALQCSESLVHIPQATRPVKIKVRDKKSGAPVSVRIHLHGRFGEYLPPKNHHRKVNPMWFEDNYGEFKNLHNQYSYIHGECIVDCPLGKVYLEITRGYEVTPIRQVITVDAETTSFDFELERVLDWRSKGWVSADTHVHFLSPSTAELEGAAEDINVVNLLASQWGEMFSNVGDFDGQTTHGAKGSGKDGEFLVRVGTENRMQVLGHMSLIGYEGAMIEPLCTGGADESAIGDTQEVLMADWAEQCRKQGGMVVLPHAPNPLCERAADIELGVIDALEMMIFNPRCESINPYGLADWYRYLNLGYHIPVVAGSDKMSAEAQLGGIRTYTQLGDLEFNYENWMQATKNGNTFVTIGPLIEFHIEGKGPGEKIQLPNGGGRVQVEWKVESVNLPVHRVEIVVNGIVADDLDLKGALSGEHKTSVRIDGSSWIALRVRGVL